MSPDLSRHTSPYILISNILLFFEPAIYRMILRNYSKSPCSPMLFFEGSFFMVSVISLMASSFALIPKKVSFDVIVYFYVMMITNYLCHSLSLIFNLELLRDKTNLACYNTTSVLPTFLSSDAHTIPLLIIINITNCLYFWRLKEYKARQDNSVKI